MKNYISTIGVCESEGFLGRVSFCRGTAILAVRAHGRDARATKEEINNLAQRRRGAEIRSKQLLCFLFGLCASARDAFARSGIFIIGSQRAGRATAEGIEFLSWDTFETIVADHFNHSIAAP